MSQRHYPTYFGIVGGQGAAGGYPNGRNDFTVIGKFEQFYTNAGSGFSNFAILLTPGDPTSDGLLMGVYQTGLYSWIQAVKVGSYYTQLWLQPNGGYTLTGLASARVGGKLFTQLANVTIVNTAAETTMFGAGSGSLTIPAGTLVAGSSLRFRFMGNIFGLGSPTLRIKVKIGGVIVADTTAATSSLTLSTNRGFLIESDLTVRTIGAAGTIIGQILGYSDGNQMSIGSKSTATVAIDTTIANVMDVTAQWGAAAAANSMIVSNATVELLP